MSNDSKNEKEPQNALSPDSPSLRRIFQSLDNRFWRVMAQVLDCPVPVSIEQKREMLLSHHIAVWDVIAGCEITGSSDASIRNVTPNDLSEILTCADIREIYTNGGKAGQLYKKYIYPANGREAVTLPSTSPANAGYSLEKLVEAWRVLRTDL